METKSEETKAERGGKKKFPSIIGGTLETTGETEKFGLKIGDMLERISTIYDYLEEIRKAKEFMLGLLKFLQFLFLFT